MVSRNKLPKVADVERESQYGYVYGVSGPGMKKKGFLSIKNLNYFLVVIANHMAGSAINELVYFKNNFLLEYFYGFYRFELVMKN